MKTHNKRPYNHPQVLQTVSVQTVFNLMFGSIVDYLYPVETTGQEVENVFDYSSFSDSEFNHSWKD